MTQTLSMLFELVVSMIPSMSKGSKSADWTRNAVEPSEGWGLMMS
jgi:hypothetical protein